MDCSDCGRTNRPGAKFCAGCAAPLVEPCASCGHDLAPEARFCDQCGTPVDADTGPDAAAAAPTTDDAVRKTVTVMFCDLAGSTSLEERVDAESSRDVLGRYHSMVEAVVGEWDGTVAKFIGDGAMVLFGVPEVGVDDADRAVAAGLELQRRFLPLRTHIADRFGIDVGLRVGINTGEVVISDDDADLVGDPLNTAARLEAACGPGQVFVGEDTWRLTRTSIAFESVGEIELKGKNRPVGTYRAVDLLAAPDESATPFVGRDDEMARLHAVFDEAISTRSLQLATVIGAPGVGKTRLSREFERSLSDRATVVELRCERAGGTTFGPIADLLRSITGLDDSMTAEEMVGELTHLLDGHDGLDDADRVAALLGSFVGAAPTRSTEETFFAVRRLAEALGRRQPTVLVVDDIQWAEPLLLDLLEHLAEWVQDSPALVLGLARPELREIRPWLAEPGRRVAESIHLEGLDAEATAELAALLVGGDALPRDLLARLPESTEGNPLFVRELMRMLVDDDVIVEADGRWELSIDADAVEVPPTIQSLLSSRIERMPDDERRLVELASVVGPEFPLGAVAAISAPGDADRLMPTLDHLRRKELVEPTGTYWGDEPLFRFHHVLIRDAAYRRLLKGTRADLHLRVASWIEDTAATVAGEQAVAIGYHLEQAHEYRLQLDLGDEETIAIGRRAAEVLGSAAARALAADDLAAAGSLAARAVTRLDDEAEARPELLTLGCEALFALGDVAGAVPLLKQLEGLSDGDPRLTAWAKAFDAQRTMLTEPDRLERAEGDSSEAAAELASLDDKAGEANARLVRAGALARLGRIGECEAELDLALGAARAADDGRRVAAVLGAAPVAALWGPSPVSRAGGRCLDVIRLLRITTGSPGVEATSTRCQAVLEALRGRFDTARSMLAEARATVEELGHRHGLLETELYSGIVELLAGDPEAAEPYLRSAYGGLGRLGIGADAGQAAAHLSRALLQQGRLDEAAELAADSEALAGQNPQTAIAAKTARAEILAARGELDEALRLAGEAVARAEGTDIVIDHANANVALARVRAAAGDVAGAREARRAAEALYDAKGASVDLGLLGAPGSTAVGPPTETAQTPPPASAPDAESLDEPWNEADRTFRAMVTQFVESPTTWVELLTDDVLFDDRRTLIGLGAAEGQEDVLALLPGPAGRAGGIATPFASRGETVVAAHVALTTEQGQDGPVSEFLAIARTAHPGLLDRVILFAPSDYRAALAELDRLYLEEVDDLAVRNKVRLWAAGFGALNDGDADGALALLDTAYVQHDHRLLGWGVQDHAEMADRVRTLADVPGDALTFIARFHGRSGPVEWAEVNLRVASSDGAVRVDVRHTVEVLSAESGLVLRTDRYGDDQIDDARVKFDELSQAAVSASELWNVAAEVGARANTWARREDRERFTASFAADLAIEDAAGQPLIGDPAEIRDPDVARRLGFGVARRRVLAVRGQRLALVELRDDTPGGEPFHRFVVEQVDDDCRIARITHFEATEQPAAEYRLARRARELGESDPDPVDDEPWNEADAVTRRAWPAIAARDADAIAAVAAPDIARDDRRRLHGVTQRGLAEVMSSLGAFDAGRSVFEAETIATRGDRLVLHRATQRAADDHHGAALEALNLIRLDEKSRVDLAITFEPDDLAAAMAEFDRLWSELDEPDESFTFADRLWTQWAIDATSAIAGGGLDFTRALSHMDEQLQMVDHRRIGWPVVDIDGFRGRLESFHGITDHGSVAVPWLHVTDGLLSLAVMETRVTQPSGGEHVDRNLMICRVSPSTGLNIRLEQFAADDLAAAMVRFREMTHEQSQDPELWNIASVVANRAHSWSRRGREVTGTLVSDDVVIEDGHGNPLLSPESDLDDSAVARRVGFGVEHRRVFAVRGDRLALMELRDDDVDGEPFHRVAVVEIDDECLISRVELYDVDSLPEALRDLGHLWLEIEQPDHPEIADLAIGSQYADATSDPAWYAEHLADDCAFVDHRPLSFGTGDKAWMIEVSESRDGMQGTPLNPFIMEWNRRGGLAPATTWIRSDSGELVLGSTPAVVVMQVTDGQISAIEMFSEDETDAARARFEELTAEAPPTAAQEPRNAADALARRVLQAYARGDLDGAPHDLDPDVRVESRRFAGSAREANEGRQAVLDGFRDAPVFAWATTLDLETVATRGDRLVLLHATYRTDEGDAGPVIEMVILVRTNTTGRADLGIGWDTDDLHIALAELDRLYLEQDPGPTMAVALRSWTEAYDFDGKRTHEAGEQMMAGLDPDLRMIDHRRIGWPEQGLETFRERILSLIELDARLSFVIARIHRGEGRLSLVEEVTTVTAPSGAVQVDRNLLLAEVGAASGLTIRMEQFAGDDLAAALAGFDERARELAAAHELENTATWLCNRLHSWARSGSWARTASSFADGVVIDDERGEVLVTGRDDLADIETARDVGFGAEHRRVLAVRGERLALMGWHGGDAGDAGDDDGEVDRRFAVVELNRLAEFERITLYDWDWESLVAAADHLDERWQTIEEMSDVDRLGIEFLDAFRHRDRERLSTILHDDYTSTDSRRSLGWGEFDRSTWLDLFDEPEDPPLATIVGSILDSSDAGIVVRMSQWAIRDGQLDEALPGCFVAAVRDDRIASSEGFAWEKPAAAITRLAELTAEMSRPTEHEPWNTADELTRGFMSRLVGRDVEAYSEDLAEDVVLDDRRALIRQRFEGREAMIALSAPGIYPPDSELVADVETIACRGEDLVLHLCSIREAGERDGPTMEWLSVASWEDGRLGLAVLLDPDDLDRAIAELDQMYVETAPSVGELALLIRYWQDAFGPTDPFDVERAMAFHDPNFEMKDHRQLGWPTQDFDGLRGRLQSIRELVGAKTMFVAKMHATRGRFGLAEFVVGSTRAAGSLQTVRSLLLVASDARSGLIIRGEQLDPEQLDLALRRLDELERDSVPEPAPSNTATWMANRVHSWWQADKWHLALSSLAEHVEITNADSATRVVSRTELADSGWARSLGFGAEHRRVLAVRGDRSALMEWQDDDLDGQPFHQFAVVELNDRAEFERITLFDWDEESLIAAADLLDDRYIARGEIDEAAATSPAFEGWRALCRHDGRRLFELMSDEAVLWDRRPLGWPRMGKAEWFEATNKVRDVRGVAVIGRILSISADALAVELAHWEFDEGGDLSEMLPGIYVATSRDGVVVRVESFPREDVDVALARLSELVSEPPPDTPSGDDEPWNEADAHSRMFFARQFARDATALREMLDEHVLIDDRRPTSRRIYEGRAEAMQAILPDVFPADPDLRMQTGTIACRGDDLVLASSRLFESGSTAFEWLVVLDWNEEGLLTRAIVFEPDNYLGAVEALDHLHLDRVDDFERFATAMAFLGYRAFSQRDEELATDAMHPDFRMVDHRGIGWPDLDLDGFRERIGSLMALDAKLESFVARLHRIGDRSVLWEEVHRVTLSNGGVQEERHYSLGRIDPRSGLTDRNDFFGIDQFAEALALFKETERASPADAGLQNVASLCGNRLNSWARLERWRPFYDAFAPEAVIEDSAGEPWVTDVTDLSDRAAARRLGFGVESRRVLAIRGDHLALVELRDPDVDGEAFHRFAVEEIGARQQIVRIALFETHELARAADDFDRRWLDLYEGEFRATGLVIARNVSAFRHLDRNAAAHTMTAEFVFADHRPMGYPTLDFDGFLATFETVGDAHGVIVATEAGELRRSGQVAPITNFGISTGGGLVENQVATAMVHVRDGAVANSEFFPADDGDAAIARLDELADD